MGLLAGSWYLERTDGASFVVSIQGMSDDPAALAATAMFFGQVADAVALLERSDAARVGASATLARRE